MPKASLLAHWVSISEYINSLSFTAFGTIYTYLVRDSIVFLYCLPLPWHFHEDATLSKLFITVVLTSRTGTSPSQILNHYSWDAQRARLAGASRRIRGLVGVKAGQGIPAEDDRRGTPQGRHPSSAARFSGARLLPCSLLFPPGLLPAHPILRERFLALEQKYFPCAVHDVEADFACLMTDGY